MLNISTLSVAVPPILDFCLPFPEPLFLLPPEGLKSKSQTVRALEDLREILFQISYNASKKNKARSGGHG